MPPPRAFHLYSIPTRGGNAFRRTDLWRNLTCFCLLPQLTPILPIPYIDRCAPFHPDCALFRPVHHSTLEWTDLCTIPSCTHSALCTIPPRKSIRDMFLPLQPASAMTWHPPTPSSAARSRPSLASALHVSPLPRLTLSPAAAITCSCHPCCHACIVAVLSVLRPSEHACITLYRAWPSPLLPRPSLAVPGLPSLPPGLPSLMPGLHSLLPWLSPTLCEPHYLHHVPPPPRCPPAFITSGSGAPYCKQSCGFAPCSPVSTSGR